MSIDLMEDLLIMRICFQIGNAPWPNSTAFMPNTEEKNPSGSFELELAQFRVLLGIINFYKNNGNHSKYQN